MAARLRKRRQTVRHQRPSWRRPAPRPINGCWKAGFNDAINGEPYDYLSPDDDSYLDGWRAGLDRIAGIEPFA